ncbi:MAG: hypothetical protein PF904_08315 [Kiritimatiellae bacterium]|jgi:hypothetical protein|nr:hypothetical protein [Kiritimatiellia bacterium]
MLFAPVTNAAGECWPDAFKVVDAAVSYSATIVTRFRWDGFATATKNPGWICNNGLDWTNYKGWLFGVVNDGSTARLSINVRHAGYNLSSENIQTGLWYEAAAVLTHNESASDSIELYLWEEGTYLKNQKWNVASVTNASTYVNVGGESGYNGYSTGNAPKSFKGALNHLALWDRPLSKAEIAEAFGAPQPVFQIGLENNSNADLGWDGEAPETYTMGEPWHLMRRAITSGSVSNAIIQVPLTSTEATLNYAFHVNTFTPDSQTAGLSLNINGTQLETLTASNDTDSCWFITPDLLITGTNSFELTYENGPASYIVFDWLEIAGSWQVGVQDLSPSEFENEGLVPDDFYVTDPNFKNMERAISHGETNTIINFALSDTVVSKYDFIYHTTIVSQGGDTPPHPFRIEVNGATIKSFDPVPNNTPIALLIHGRLLQEGNNTISIVIGETSGWLQFDYHKLNVLKRYGTLIMLH